MVLQVHNERSYASRRFPAYGKRGMVATSNSLAAQAGLDMLKKGGNAVDAALAAAACLTYSARERSLGSGSAPSLLREGLPRLASLCVYPITEKP